METMKTKLPMPNVGLAMRENGDVTIESRLEGQIVGEFNLSAVMKNWLRKVLDRRERPELKSV